jgi:hypothetical protein
METRNNHWGWPWWLLAWLPLAAGVYVTFRLVNRPCRDTGLTDHPAVERDSLGVIQDEFVGKRRAEVIHRFGQPTFQWDGHYGLPSGKYVSEHSPATTMSYRRPGGILYLSFEWRCGEWICFSSTWVPNGVAVD